MAQVINWKMIKSIYTSAAGMIARQTELETVANNLANVNTTGFKGDRRVFRETIDNRLLQGAAPVWQSDSKPFYDLAVDFNGGPLVQTGNPLDVAIAGKGFFTVETQNGIAYTRNGNFSVNESGELVNAAGDRVMGDGGPVRLEAGKVSINESGDLFVNGKQNARLTVVDFPEPYKMKRIGNGYFIPEEDSAPIAAASPRILQGQLENSNVDPVGEMIKMIELSRSYEACQKAVLAQDETLKMATGDLGR